MKLPYKTHHNDLLKGEVEDILFRVVYVLGWLKEVLLSKFTFRSMVVTKVRESHLRGWVAQSYGQEVTRTWRGQNGRRTWDQEPLFCWCYASRVPWRRGPSAVREELEDVKIREFLCTGMSC